VKPKSNIQSAQARRRFGNSAWLIGLGLGSCTQLIGIDGDYTSSDPANQNNTNNIPTGLSSATSEPSNNAKGGDNGDGGSTNDGTGKGGTSSNGGTGGNGENSTNLCGNGSVDATEECDDTNQVNNDGCDSNCKVECNSNLYGWFKDPVGHSCYVIVNAQRETSFDAYRNACRGLGNGFEIAVLCSPQELKFLRTQPNLDAVVGIQQAPQPEGPQYVTTGWSWITFESEPGCEFDPKLWSSGQPNDNDALYLYERGKEQCGRFSTSRGGLNDSSCQQDRFLCERSAQSVSMPLSSGQDLSNYGATSLDEEDGGAVALPAPDAEAAGIGASTFRPCISSTWLRVVMSLSVKRKRKLRKNKAEEKTMALNGLSCRRCIKKTATSRALIVAISTAITVLALPKSA